MTQKKARAKLVDDHWIVTAPPHIMVRIKRVLRGVDGRALGTVMLSDTLDNCRDLEWFAQRYPIEIMHRDYLERRAQAHRDQEELLELVLSKSYKPRRFKLAVPPRKYQRQGAELALASGGLLLADELGVGKTATAIAMLSDPVTRPALVVVPANLQTQWKAEIAKFAPSLKVHIVERLEPYDPGSQDVYVMSYNKLHRWAEVLEPVINSAVYDEVHELRRGYQSKKGTAALFLADKVKFRLGLSATPSSTTAGRFFGCSRR